MTSHSYPAEVRLFARGLFIQGNTLVECAKAVKVQFPGTRCNAETIRRWSVNEEWEVPKKEVALVALNEQKQSVVEKLQEHERLYDKMIRKGEAGLDDENVLPRSASEAGALLDTGIKGQRAALKELVSLKFVKAVVDVVCDEVPDDETRRRIGVRLKELAEASL